MSILRGSNLVFHLTTSIESDLISCSDHPDSHFSKPPPVGPAALISQRGVNSRGMNKMISPDPILTVSVMRE